MAKTSVLQVRMDSDLKEHAESDADNEEIAALFGVWSR